MKPQLTLEAFADWCEKQPAEKTYNYADCNRCACGQYAATLGLQGWAGVKVYQPGEFWYEANCAAAWEDTFGALAKRLRSAR
jgi:hypothetical protein